MRSRFRSFPGASRLTAEFALEHPVLDRQIVPKVLRGIADNDDILVGKFFRRPKPTIAADEKSAAGRRLSKAPYPNTDGS